MFKIVKISNLNLQVLRFIHWHNLFRVILASALLKIFLVVYLSYKNFQKLYKDSVKKSFKTYHILYQSINPEVQRYKHSLKTYKIGREMLKF